MTKPVDTWSLLEEARVALVDLLHLDQKNTCAHEDTHRGGSIWTICDACGTKWADDEGGKPEWTPPAEWTKAEAVISKLAKLRPSDVFAEETWAIRQDSDKRHKMMAHMDAKKQTADPEDYLVHETARAIWEAMLWTTRQRQPMPKHVKYTERGNSDAECLVRAMARRIIAQVEQHKPAAEQASPPGPTFDEWLKEGAITTRGERLEQFMGMPDDFTTRQMMVSWLVGAWNAGIASGQPVPRDPDTGFRLDGKSFYPYDKG